MIFFSSESFYGLIKAIGRMFGNQLISIVNSPGSIQKLSDFHLGLGIKSSVRSGGDIDDQPSDPHGVIVSGGSFVAETDEAVQVESFGDGAPGLLREFGRNRESTIVIFNEACFEELIGCFEAMGGECKPVGFGPPGDPGASCRVVRSCLWLGVKGNR